MKENNRKHKLNNKGIKSQETSLYDVGKEYCDYLENNPVEDIEKVMLYLLDLYKYGLLLPKDIEPNESEISGDIKIDIKINIPDEFYVLYNPFDIDDRCANSFSDALKDIYLDIKTGIIEYEKGYKENALWYWELMCDHWGKHIVESLYVLDYLKNNGGEYL